MNLVNYGLVHMGPASLSFCKVACQVAPYGWLVGAAFRRVPGGWYARQAQNALLRLPPPPLPPLAFHLLYPSVCERGRERRKRKFESGEVCSIVRNLPRIPSGGRRIPGFRARADGPLCQPHWRSWMRFIASTMLSGSTCAHHLCMPWR